jgi:hypothetical protein
LSDDDDPDIPGDSGSRGAGQDSLDTAAEEGSRDNPDNLKEPVQTRLRSGRLNHSDHYRSQKLAISKIQKPKSLKCRVVSSCLQKKLKRYSVPLEANGMPYVSRRFGEQEAAAARKNYFSCRDFHILRKAAG